jgi:hypothetical protein
VLLGTGSNLVGVVDVADRSWFKPSNDIPAGTVVEITGPFIETGTCDLWPIRYDVGSGLLSSTFEGFIDERDLRSAD